MYDAHNNYGHIQGTSNTRHRLVLIIAGIVAVAAVVLFLKSGGSAAEATEAEGASTVLGLSRAAIGTTPNSEILAKLDLPRGVKASLVSWTVTPIGVTEFTPIGGTGTEVSFTAPVEGNVRLITQAQVSGRKVRSATVFAVREASEFMGTSVTYQGRVRIDGGPAVTGEAMRQGAKVDASKGSISFMARAREDGSRYGKMTLDGVFVVSSKNIGNNKTLNTITAERPPAGSRTVTADVEHLSEERYVAVQTPDALAMVKGTRFETTVGESGSTIDTERGNVAVYDRYRYTSGQHDVLADDPASTIDESTVAQAIEEWTDATRGPQTAAEGESAPPTTAPVKDFEQSVSDETEASERLLQNIVRADAGGELLPEVGEVPIDETTAEDGVEADPLDLPVDDTAPLAEEAVTNTTGETPVETAPEETVAETPRPPLNEPYVFERFNEDRCVPTHRLWNDLNNTHLCVPHTQVSTIFSDNKAYKPFVFEGSNWGCFGTHLTWSRNKPTDGSTPVPTWCLAVASNFAPKLPYRPPPGLIRNADGTTTEKHSIEVCFQPPAGSVPQQHYFWSDKLCHGRAE